MSDPSPATSYARQLLTARRCTQKGQYAEAIRKYSQAKYSALVRNLNPEYLLADAAIRQLEGALTVGQEEQLNAANLDAIHLLEELLQTSSSEMIGLVHLYLGSCYQEVPDFSLAREHYSRSLDFELYGAKPWSLNNLAGLEIKDGRRREGLSLLNESLAELSGSPPCEALDITYLVLYGKGITLAEDAQDLEDAEIALLESSRLVGDDVYNAGVIFRDLGSVHWMRDKQNEAIEAWQVSMTYFAQAVEKQSSDRERLAMTNEKLRLAASHRRSRSDENILRWLPERASYFDNFSNVEEKLFAKSVSVAEDVFETYNQRPSRQPVSDSAFYVARGWGSALPLLLNPDLDSGPGSLLGGGYFLLHNGYGLALDPGFQFLNNFFSQGFHLRQICGIAVSHNHPDHNADIWNIDNLRYEMFNRAPDADKSRWGYDLVLDGDTKSQLRTFWVNEADTIWNTQRNFLGSKPDSYFANVTIPTQKLGNEGFDHDGISISTFKVFHGENVARSSGMRIQLNRDGMEPIEFAYTGDMRYDEALCANDKLGSADILLLHISQPDREDFLKRDHLKAVHLGYNGTLRLIEASNPKGPVLVGEFWGGRGDFRIEIIRALRKRSGRRDILPAGLGLVMDLARMQVQCSRCGKGFKASEIFIVKPRSHYSKLDYLCETCFRRYDEPIRESLSPAEA